MGDNMRWTNALTLMAMLLLADTVNSAQAQSRSAVVCDSYARDYASQPRGQVLGGAAKGSLLGAGIGAIAGGAATGAAIGAVVGVIGGGARRHAEADRSYNAAYQDCMSGRVR
jgi:uncharacterized membrane protein